MTSYHVHDHNHDDANKRAAGANGGRGTNGAGASYRASIADATEIERALRAVLAPGQVTEVRALDAVGRGDRRAMTYSGYFDEPAALAAAVAATLVSAKGVYFVPNPVHPGLLARAVNRLRPAGKDPTTSDVDVAARRWLLVDLDPARPSGISATDAEHDAALDRARAVADHLSGLGWPDPVEGDSGNGGHLMYRVDLPADDGGLVERCLRALDARFGHDAVRVDITTHNPSRLWKLYGTRAGKGDDAGAACGRPHRLARVLRVPDDVRVVARGQLEALAGPGPDATTPTPAKPKGPRPATGRAFDIDAWLRERGVAVAGPTDWSSRGGVGKRWVLDVCPWDPAHADGSAYIVQFPTGAVEAGCHHNGCAGRGWHDLRDLWEPGWRDSLNGAARPERVADVTSDKGVAGYAPAGGPPAAWPDPQPLPPELPPVARFDFDLLPEVLRPWVQDIADRVQCPPDFPAVGAMVALAAIVGRRVGIRPKRHDDWLVVANLWGMVIGRPGIMKTPALQEPLKPLKRLETDAKRAYDDEAREHEVHKAVADQERELRKTAIRQRLKAGASGDAVAEEMLAAAAAAAAAAADPVRRRYLVNDSSVEKLGEILNQNRNGVLAFRNELIGLLKGLDKEGQEGARSFYLEAWNGTGRYTYDRIGRGTLDIDAAVVSVLGGVQPGPLADYLRGAAASGAGDDGLLQRFQLAVWPDVERAWVNVDRWPDGEARRAAFDLFARLDDLSATDVGAEPDPHDPDGVPFLRFDAAAQRAFDDWRAGLEAKVRSGEERPAVESHLSKYRSLVPSLALLCHLADAGHGPVTAEALGRAVQWAAYLESHARRIFSPAVLSATGSARALAAKLRAGAVADGFALKDVYHNGWSRLSTRADAAAAAAELLADLDWLAESVEGSTGGRNRTRYWVNPKALAAGGGAGGTPSGLAAGAVESGHHDRSGSSGGGPAGGDGTLPVATTGSGRPPEPPEAAAAAPGRERGRL